MGVEAARQWILLFHPAGVKERQMLEIPQSSAGVG
jgi:hypothetical protein